MIDLQIEVFLLIAIGFTLTKLGMFSESTRKQVTNIVMYIILPCTIIRSFEIDLTKDLITSTGIVFLISIGIQAFSAFINRFLWTRQPDDRRINCEYGTIVSNAGFMGMPFSQEIFGDIGLLYACIFLIPQRICMFSYGLSLYAKDESGNVWKKVLLHPCIVAIYIGLVVMILRMFNIYLPTSVDNTLGAIANCNTAMSMIVIGGILSDVKLTDLLDKTTWYFTAIRLLVLPIVLLLIIKVLPIETVSGSVCVLETAMPAASTTAMLAQTYNRDPKFASNIVFVSTMASMITLPLVMMLI